MNNDDNNPDIVLLKFISGAHGIINNVDLKILNKTDVENFIHGLAYLTGRIIDEIGDSDNKTPLLSKTYRTPLEPPKREGRRSPGVFSSLFLKRPKEGLHGC